MDTESSSGQFNMTWTALSASAVCPLIPDTTNSPLSGCDLRCLVQPIKPFLDCKYCQQYVILAELCFLRYFCTLMVQLAGLWPVHYVISSVITSSSYLSWRSRTVSFILILMCILLNVFNSHVTEAPYIVAGIVSSSGPYVCSMTTPTKVRNNGFCYWTVCTHVHSYDLHACTLLIIILFLLYQ